MDFVNVKYNLQRNVQLGINSNGIVVSLFVTWSVHKHPARRNYLSVARLDLFITLQENITKSGSKQVRPQSIRKIGTISFVFYRFKQKLFCFVSFILLAFICLYFATIFLFFSRQLKFKKFIACRSKVISYFSKLV